jgi:hypothetical protein
MNILQKIKYIDSDIKYLQCQLKLLKNSNERHCRNTEISEQISSLAKHRETLKLLLLPKNIKRLIAYQNATK